MVHTITPMPVQTLQNPGYNTAGTSGSIAAERSEPFKLRWELTT